MDIAAATSRLEKFEGVINHMYSDTEGTVTYGVGHAASCFQDAQFLPWVDNNGNIASKASIALDYGLVKTNGSSKTVREYEALTQCRLERDVIDRLTSADVAKFASQLEDKIKGYLTLPEPAQEALFDMAYNLGIGGLLKYQKMLAAVYAKDWEAAANESFRNGIQASRNQEIAGLFRQCA